MSRPLDVVAALTRITRDFTTPGDLDTTLRALVTVVRDAAPGVDHASLAVRPARERLRTVAATDDVAARLDALQAEVGEGPGLHVMSVEQVVLVDRMLDEGRWSSFSDRARYLGVTAYAGVRVQADEHTVGALSLWSRSRALDEEVLEVADLVGAHAGLMMGHARRLENLSAALESRTVIGMAMGMTMQRLGLDEETAFSYLTRLSATSETKLREVAASLVQQHHDGLLTRRGGSLPEAPA